MNPGDLPDIMQAANRAHAGAYRAGKRKRSEELIERFGGLVDQMHDAGDRDLLIAAIRKTQEEEQ